MLANFSSFWFTLLNVDHPYDLLTGMYQPPKLQRKFRQASSFGSFRGASVTFYLQAQRLNAGWSKTKTTWWQASHSLFFDLLNLIGMTQE
jgi:hypothetical protein